MTDGAGDWATGNARSTTPSGDNVAGAGSDLDGSSISSVYAPVSVGTHGSATTPASLDSDTADR